MRRVPGYPLWLGHVGDVRNLTGIHAVGILALIDLAMDEPPAMVTRELVYCRFPLIDGPGNPSLEDPGGGRDVGGLAWFPDADPGVLRRGDEPFPLHRGSGHRLGSGMPRRRGPGSGDLIRGGGCLAGAVGGRSRNRTFAPSGLDVRYALMFQGLTPLAIH